MKPIKGYHITRGYRSATIWFFGRMTLRRVMTVRFTPGPKLTRRQRYAEIARILKAEKIPVPVYREHEKR